MVSLGSFLLTMLLVAGTAGAAHHEGGDKSPKGHERGHGGSGASMVLKHADQLGLDEATQAKISELNKAARESGHSRHKDMKALHEEMRELMNQDSPDEAAVMALAERMGAAKTEAQKVNLSNMLKVQALLTPEQREKLKSIRAEKRAEGHGKKHGDGECSSENCGCKKGRSEE